MRSRKEKNSLLLVASSILYGIIFLCQKFKHMNKQCFNKLEEALEVLMFSRLMFPKKPTTRGTPRGTPGGTYVS